MTISRQASLTFLMLCYLTVSHAVSIKGTVKNSAPGKMVYLYEYYGELLMVVDSASISKNGSFNFGKNKTYHQGLYRIGSSKDSSSIAIIGKEDLEITTSLPGFTKNFGIKNSPENELLKEYIKVSTTFSSDVNLLQKRFDQSATLAESNQEEYNRVVASLKTKYDSLVKVKNKNLEAIVQKSPNSFTAKIASSYILPDSLKPTTYFKPTDYTDSDLVRGDMLSNKIKTYFQLFVQPQEQALASAVNDILLKMPIGSPNREVAMISMLSLFSQFQMIINKQIKTQLKSEYPNSKYTKAFLPSLKQDAPDVGDIAPNIVMNDTSGKTVSLESLRGKVVLLDFWASWCGPCRMENPNVVRAYNKYSSKGFTVFSVSFDNSREKWIQALKKDGLTWTHVSELRGWETSAGKLYQVTGIPATYLIGKDGKIIARNLRGPALDEMLEKVLTP